MEAGEVGGWGAAVLPAGRLHHASRVSHSFCPGSGAPSWKCGSHSWKNSTGFLRGPASVPSPPPSLSHFRWRRKRAKEWAGSLLLGAPEARGDGAQRQSLLLLLGRELRQTLLLLLVDTHKVQSSKSRVLHQGPVVSEAVQTHSPKKSTKVLVLVRLEPKLP